MVNWLDWLFWSIAWLERGFIVAIVISALVSLKRWGWFTFRLTRDPGSRRDSRQMGSPVATTLVLLLVVVAGFLLLRFDRPGHHSGSCLLMVGMMGFLGPLGAGPRPGDLAWRPRSIPLEVMAICLSMLLGAVNCL